MEIEYKTIHILEADENIQIFTVWNLERNHDLAI